MTSLIRALSSSIGKKLLMGLTGLALCGFLVVHLSGNLLLYLGADKYDAYAHALHAQTILLPIAEVGLFGLLILHILLGLTTARENWAARKHRYDTQQSKVVEPTSAGLPNLASKLMVPTGIIVLLFLIVHIGHFKLHIIPPANDPIEGKAAMAMHVLASGFTQAVYLIGTLVLGFHLVHGFQSAFQSLGINHPKYTKGIKVFGFIFATVIALGFASFPLMGLMGYFNSDAATSAVSQPADEEAAEKPPAEKPH